MMQTVTWAVDADGDWSNAADWSPTGVPTYGDNVVIDTADLHTVTHSTGASFINTLNVGNDDFVMSGGTITMQGEGASSFANLLTLSGGTLNFTRNVVTIVNFVQTGGLLRTDGNETVTGSASFTGSCKQYGNGDVKITGTASVASGATVMLRQNILAFAGTTTIAGSVTGTGELIINGGTTTLESGAGVGTGNWVDEGGIVQLAENLTYANSFFFGGNASTAATITLGGFGLTLTGAVRFSGYATVTGPGSLSTLGATTLANFTPTGMSLGSSVTWFNSGTVTEDGTTAAQGLGGTGAVVNQSSGVYDLAGDTGLTAASFINNGLLEKTAGVGTSKIAAPVTNTGTLSVSTGTLLFAQKVIGRGVATISGGNLQFNGAFNENVNFSGASGALILGHSQTYGGTVSGFSLSGGTSLDLRDIGFVSAGEATFSGTTAGGILTVTDGTHTASIKLTGDYLGSTFTTSSDGAGGTIVVDPSKGASTQAFVSAMAGLAAPAAVAIHAGWAGEAHALMLAGPHTMSV